VGTVYRDGILWRAGGKLLTGKEKEALSTGAAVVVCLGAVLLVIAFIKGVETWKQGELQGESFESTSEPIRQD
jgi:hypothetical protein